MSDDLSEYGDDVIEAELNDVRAKLADFQHYGDSSRIRQVRQMQKDILTLEELLN